MNNHIEYPNTHDRLVTYLHTMRKKTMLLVDD